MRIKLTVLFFAMLGTCIGCEADGSPFHAVLAPPNMSVIYIYRPSGSYYGSGVALDIKCDGKKFSTLQESGYTYALVTPGPHTISCETETKSEIPFTAELGRSYYIDAEVEEGFFVGRPRLTMVPEDTGKLAIPSTRQSDDSKEKK